MSKPPRYVVLDKKIGEHVKKDDILYTLYSEKAYTLKEAKDSLKNLELMDID